MFALNENIPSSSVAFLSSFEQIVIDYSMYLLFVIELRNRFLLTGKTNEEFDADRKARELRKKLSIHDPMEL